MYSVWSKSWCEAVFKRVLGRGLGFGTGKTVVVALKGFLTKAVRHVISSISLFFFFVSTSIYNISTRTIRVLTHSLPLSPYFSLSVQKNILFKLNNTINKIKHPTILQNNWLYVVLFVDSGHEFKFSMHTVCLQ